jgi:hypothetical protein
VAVGPSAPIRPLTRDEYSNALRDLLGDDSRPGDGLPADEVFLGLALGGTMSEPKVQALSVAAAEVAQRATTRLGALLPCDPNVTPRDACASMFITRLARRAFRRPPTADETKRLLAVYQGSVAADGFAAAVGLVIEAVLQSPHFLYVVETGDGALTSHEVAARLALFLWSSLPDQQLDAAADANGLLDARALEAQARRLLADKRSEATLRQLHRDWLGLGDIDVLTKDAKLFPIFDYQLRASMEEETYRFVADAFARAGTLGALLTTPASVIDKNVARIYGLAAPATWTSVALPAGQRAGLLTQPSLLALNAHPTHTSPVLRGRLVRDAFLCAPPPPPPPDVSAVLPTVDPSTPTRERYVAHSKDPACAGCHRLIDPIGFGFESYDAVGRYRATEAGRPVDASGHVSGAAELDGGFTGVVELAAKLAGSRQVRDCVARRWFRFALKRGEDGDAGSLGPVVETFSASGGDLRALAVALVTSPAFRFRRPGS